MKTTQLIPGARIGAIRNETRTTIFAHGVGVYEGNFKLGEEVVGATADMVRASGATANPRLLLDNGDRVWGAECWWMSEEDFKAKIAAAELQRREIVWVTAEQTRNQARQDIARAEELDMKRREALETILDGPIRPYLVRTIEEEGTNRMVVVKDEEHGELVCLVVKLPGTGEPK